MSVLHVFSEFENRLSRSTEEQKKIVCNEKIENVVVISCAGSGKTDCIVMRICFLLSQGMCQANEILVLTFTKNAALELEGRIQQFTHGASVTTGTFHSIARAVLAVYAPEELKGMIHVDEYQFIFAKLLKTKPEVFLPWLSQFKQVFVDEFQDVNPIQSDIIDRLYNYSPGNQLKLMMVGDDDQNIYSFRGSSSVFLQKAVEKYHPCKICFLSVNFRSRTPIVKMANQIIKAMAHQHREQRRIHKPEIKAFIQSSSLSTPRIFEHPSDFDLLEHVAQEINQLIRERHVSPEEIVVLSRTSVLLQHMESLLLAKYKLESIVMASSDRDREAKAPNLSGKVVLATIHAVKGLQFERVYIVGLNETFWSTTDPDEWRCFYVAATRAQNFLTICHSTLNPSAFITKLEGKVAHRIPLDENNSHTIIITLKEKIPSVHLQLENSPIIIGALRSLQCLDGNDYLVLKEEKILPDFLMLPLEDEQVKQAHFPHWVSRLHLEREYGVFIDYLSRRMVAEIMQMAIVTDRIVENVLKDGMWKWKHVSVPMRSMLLSSYEKFKDVKTTSWENLLPEIYNVSLMYSAAMGKTAPLHIKVDSKFLFEEKKNFTKIFKTLKRMVHGHPRDKVLLANSISDTLPASGVTIRGEIDLVIGDQIVDIKASSRVNSSSSVDSFVHNEFLVQLLLYASMMRTNGSIVNSITIFNTLSNNLIKRDISNWKRHKEFFEYVATKSSKK